MKLLRLNRRRKKCFSILAIVLVFLLVPLILICNANYGQSWLNNSLKHIYRERGCHQYVFVDSQYAFKVPGQSSYRTHHYGVHDWIADSALRMVRLDPLYPKRLTNWILDDSIPYKDFDTYPNNHMPIQRGWFAEQTKFGSNNDDTNWMRNRRYARFLFGTGAPDWNLGHYDIRSNVIAFESAAIRAEFLMLGSYVHHIYFDENGDINLGNSPAALLAMEAADIARHYLSYRKTIRYLGKDITIKGKWEAGAFALGAMTHLIGDVAHPFHVIPGRSYHFHWDNVADELCGWDQISGGPDWTRINPSLYTVSLIPIHPWIASTELAKIARDFGGPHDATTAPVGITSSDTYWVEWIKYLLNKAVWYTACAMLWILLQSDISDDTFSDRWQNGRDVISQKKTSMFGAKLYTPLDIQAIKQQIRAVEGEARAEWYNPGIGGLGLASLIYFAPLLAVVGIPVLVQLSRLYFELLKGKPISA